MLDSRKREIRIEAENFRSHCKVGKYGIIDLFEECNARPYKLIRYPLGEHAEMGFALKKDEDIVIFTNSSVRLSREIFTLAHEIGHVILHLDREASFVDNQNTIGNGTDIILEQEANFFAACLLMPKDEVDKFVDLEIGPMAGREFSALDVAKIMSAFKVSFEMAIHRLETLGIIDSRTKRRLETERNGQRVGHMLNAIGGDKSLNDATRCVVLPFEYLDYVIYNYNHGVIPKETLLRAVECYGFTIEDIKDKLTEVTEKESTLEELIGGLED